jgi:hypothetical protein
MKQNEEPEDTDIRGGSNSSWSKVKGERSKVCSALPRSKVKGLRLKYKVSGFTFHISRF